MPKHKQGLADALVAMPGIAGSAKGLIKHKRDKLIAMLWEVQCALCDREEEEAVDEGNETPDSSPERRSGSDSDGVSETEMEEEPEPEPEPELEPEPAPAPAARQAPKGKRAKAQAS